MRSITTEGMICLDDRDLVYDISLISFTEFEDETFAYEFQPLYPVIDLLEPAVFQGIPGLDLTLRRASYMRKNTTPVFIEERSPAPNRENLWRLLEAQGMKRLNRLEWLIRSGSRYSGDNLFVRPLTSDDSNSAKPIRLSSNELSALPPHQAISTSISPFIHGKTCVIDGIMLDGMSRKAVFGLLRALYLSQRRDVRERRLSGAARAAQEGRMPGRKRKPIDRLRLAELAEELRAGRISSAEAAQQLDISVATLYRRLQELR